MCIITEGEKAAGVVDKRGSAYLHIGFVQVIVIQNLESFRGGKGWRYVKTGGDGRAFVAIFVTLRSDATGFANCTSDELCGVGFRLGFRSRRCERKNGKKRESKAIIMRRNHFRC